LKFLVKNNVFALGALHKAGTTIDIDQKFEPLFKGAIEKVVKPKPKKAVNEHGDK
jgi:hypothetical protein